MGGKYSDIDVTSRPLLSARDFQDRIAKWLEEVDAEDARGQAMVIWFPRGREDLIKHGNNFNPGVGATCQKCA